MTENRRIFWNVTATYGRSVYALICGLLSERWAYFALGVVDYGLYGLVGGLTAFVVFANQLMASAVGRFYAYSVGASRIAGHEAEGIEECRRWFSTAVLIHTALPVVLILIGWPVGEWFVSYRLTIPPERLRTCIWVWRFVCVTCFVGMLNVPFQAMYTAKQEIAELTFYDFATTTLRVVFLRYMVLHPGEWLLRYAFWMGIMCVAPQVLICLRAAVVFPECRLRPHEMWNVARLKQLGVYAGARFWAALATMMNTQGMAILVNKTLSVTANAAMSVSGKVSSNAIRLSSSLSSAMWPAIVNAAGKGDFARMRVLSYSVCKISTLCLLAFAIPLWLEISEVLVLWLRVPPIGAAPLCSAILVSTTLEKLTVGHWMSIFAIGRIARYELVVGLVGLSGVFIAWGFVALGFGIVAVGLAGIAIAIFDVGMRLWFARSISGLGAWHWLRNIMFPLALCTALSMAAGLLSRLFLAESFARILMTTIFCEAAFLPSVWFIALSRDEQAYISVRIQRILRKKGSAT